MSLLSLTKKIGAKRPKRAVKDQPEKSAKTAVQPQRTEEASLLKIESLRLWPVLSEKSVRLQESGTVVFKVTPESNKRQIARAVAGRYKVKVLAVKTINQMPKSRRRGNSLGRTTIWKKAYVTVDNVQAVSAGP